MRILFTGGSSFTGYWFIRGLADAGHEVVATFRRRPDEYPDGIRRERVSLALKSCCGIFASSFGDERFLGIVRDEKWDLLCHHAAEAANYRSADFDVAAALANNTRNIAGVLDALRTNGAERTGVLLTGSVFENDEGAGSEGLPAFSPYGVSKGLTYQVFRYHTRRVGLGLGKFVIPNPFGPYEDARYTAYLMTTWLGGKKATVNTPAYVRDNIHVSLLAKAYVRFAEELPASRGEFHVRPSGYAECQGAFTQRLAAAMRERLALPCEFELKAQDNFPEPRVRINTDIPDAATLGWSEEQAWNELASYYRQASRP